MLTRPGGPPDGRIKMILADHAKGTSQGAAEEPDSAVCPHSKPRQLVALVADDDALFLKLVVRLMRKEGYRVLAASDGQAGLDLSRRYPGSIDLVITDMQMPRLNGTGLCARLLAERPGIKALLISAADASEIAAQIAGFPFLPKPMDGQILRAKVRAIMET